MVANTDFPLSLLLFCIYSIEVSSYFSDTLYLQRRTLKQKAGHSHERFEKTPKRKFFLKTSC
jgi:hypothetical protein